MDQLTPGLRQYLHIYLGGGRITLTLLRNIHADLVRVGEVWADKVITNARQRGLDKRHARQALQRLREQLIAHQARLKDAREWLVEARAQRRSG